MSRRSSTTAPAVTERRFRRRSSDRVQYPHPDEPVRTDPWDDEALLVRARLLLLGHAESWPAWGEAYSLRPNRREFVDAGLIVACRSCGGPTLGVRPPAQPLSGEKPISNPWPSTCETCQSGWERGAVEELLRQVEGATDRAVAEVRAHPERYASAVWHFDQMDGARKRQPQRPWSHLAGAAAPIKLVRGYRWPSVGVDGATQWIDATELAETPYVPDVFARQLDDVERRLRGREVVPPPEEWGIAGCWWCGSARAQRRHWRHSPGGRHWCGGSDGLCARPDSDNVTLTGPRALARALWGAGDPPDDGTGQPSRIASTDLEWARRGGFTFWGEVEGRAPNREPWAHLDADLVLDSIEWGLAVVDEEGRRIDWYRSRPQGVTYMGPDGKPATRQEPWLRSEESIREWRSWSMYPDVDLDGPPPWKRADGGPEATGRPERSEPSMN